MILITATNSATATDLMDIYGESTNEPSLLKFGLFGLPDDGFAIIYYKSKTATGVVLEPIWSTNLLEDVWMDTGMSTEYLDETAERERWKGTLPADIPAGFIRLRATTE